MGSTRILNGVLLEMLAHAQAKPAVECCGLLGGRDDVISVILPATNSLASPMAYEIAAPELFILFRRIREQRLELLGIYHSHPHTENAPSLTDVQRAYYPGVVYFIISPRKDAIRPVRAFRIVDGEATELAIEIV